MANTTVTEALPKVVFTRHVAGAEDLIFGFGAVSQIRGGDNVVVTMINADTIPYDNTRSVKQALDELFANQALNNN